jgi:hypothetical protein
MDSKNVTVDWQDPKPDNDKAQPKLTFMQTGDKRSKINSTAK